MICRTSADEVVSNGGQLERLVVASQGIAASTAQLVVASRVKASRNSTNMTHLSSASRDVTQATAGVVATAKSCMRLVEDSGKYLRYCSYQWIINAFELPDLNIDKSKEETLCVLWLSKLKATFQESDIVYEKIICIYVLFYFSLLMFEITSKHVPFGGLLY